MKSVAFVPNDEEWLVLGERRKGGPEGGLVLAREELSHLAAVDLKNALAAEKRIYEAETTTAIISDVPKQYLDFDTAVGQVEIEHHGDSLLVSVYFFSDWPQEGVETEAIDATTRLVKPFVKQNKAHLVDVWTDEWMSSPQDLCIKIRVRPSWRGQSVKYLADLGSDLVRLCEAHSAGEVNRETVPQLVRGGGAHLLIGQEEGNWLDAKAEEYNLENPEGRISLAQSVARFANAEDGGVVVIGAKTKRIPGGEVFRSIDGVAPRWPDTRARYLRVLNQNLYPPPLGLRIDVVPTQEDKSLILVDIPPQPEELKPFLVHGAIMNTGRVEGSFISIVQRRGEGSIPITAPMIHASLAAGRALLRGGQGSAPTGRQL